MAVTGCVTLTPSDDTHPTMFIRASTNVAVQQQMKNMLECSRRMAPIIA